MEAAPASLRQKIARLIELNGPISLSDYMHIAMADPQFGYYKTRESIGRKGDFITAPEISQMFGELLGVWCISVWHSLGRPDPFCLAELGPGKGSLMKDLLRAAKSDAGFCKAANIVLVETSDRLVEIQKQAIPQEWTSQGKISWEMDIAALPAMPTIIVANEFLDVIPIRQFVKRSGNWHEIGVAFNEDKALHTVALANNINEKQLPKGALGEPEGAVFEYAPAREAVVETLAAHLVEKGGTALIIDYGHLQSGFGDTFQAMGDHAYVDPLSNPGNFDITSHVDFEALTKTAKRAGIETVKMTDQGSFLLALGLLERAGALGSNKSALAQEKIRSEVERLAGPDQMGTLFKVMALSTMQTQLPGFGTNQLEST